MQTEYKQGSFGGESYRHWLYAENENRFMPPLRERAWAIASAAVR